MPNLNYSDQQLQQLINGIFEGHIDPSSLPEDLYHAISKHLEKALYKGFKKSLGQVKFGTVDYELLAELRENIYLFSAARTFQQTLEMSQALTDDNDKLVTYDEFKKKAEEIYTRYNGGKLEEDYNPGWIEAEYNTAVLQGYNSTRWNRIYKQKDTFPYLRRVAVGDDATCEICGELNGIVLPVDDPAWAEIGGMAHFNCRCIEEQLEAEEGEEAEWDDEEVLEVVMASEMPEEFKYNPYIQREVFLSEGKGKHPYFVVPKEYKELAKRNFDLDIPEPDEE